jgi:hypothetical protein
MVPSSFILLLHISWNCFSNQCVFPQDVAAYRATSGPTKSDAGKKSGPGRPTAKKAAQVEDDDDDDDDDDEDDDDDDDDEDD